MWVVPYPLFGRVKDPVARQSYKYAALSLNGKGYDIESFQVTYHPSYGEVWSPPTPLQFMRLIGENEVTVVVSGMPELETEIEQEMPFTLWNELGEVLWAGYLLGSIFLQRDGCDFTLSCRQVTRYLEADKPEGVPTPDQFSNLGLIYPGDNHKEWTTDEWEEYYSTELNL